MPHENAPSNAALHPVDVSETERHIAMCVPSESIGIGKGHEVWLIFTANKLTENVTCSVSLTLPAMFLPR
jgi:hypothetical protein